MKKLVIILTVLLSIISITGSGQAKVKGKPKVDINNKNAWTFIGDAYYTAKQKAFVLTEERTWQSGAIWLKMPHTDKFQLDMDYYTGVSSTPLGGADGIVIAFYANNSYHINSGGTLGFNGSRGYGIELDTYYNPEYNDVKYNHIALIRGQNDNHLTLAKLSESEDGRWHHLSIKVNGNTCNVYVDGSITLSYEKLKKTGYNSLGIIATTGNGTNWHVVKNLELK